MCDVRREGERVESTVIVDVYMCVQVGYLVITLEPIDGWESFDHNTWYINLISYGVHFNNGDIVIALQLSSEAVPDRG